MDLAKNGQSDWGLGVLVGDFDDDGDMDLYVGNDYNGPGDGFLNDGDNIYYRNNGDGTFTDVTDDAGLTLVQLYWEYNDIYLPCPAEGGGWSCDVNGSEYTWRVAPGNRPPVRPDMPCSPIISRSSNAVVPWRSTPQAAQSA